MFKPLLSPNNSPLDTPNYLDHIAKFLPLIGSPKLDGIRSCPRGGKVLSRTLKPLPSQQVQIELGKYEFVDAESIEGDETDTQFVYNRTQSYVMSKDKIGDMSYRVFDWTEDSRVNEEFYMRLDRARGFVASIADPLVTMVEHVELDSIDAVLNYEDKQLEKGYEGIMLRNPVGRYKTNARCTFLDGIIFKLKRALDDEAVVIGLVEEEKNNNPLFIDERGYAKRSTNKENMVPANTLGKLQCLYKDVLISVAPGALTHKERKLIWDEWDTEKTIQGRTIKFRYFPKGQKDLPRHPRFVGFRDQMDIVKE